MHAPKDLQHDFDVEPLLNEFVTSIGGELVSELISANPDFENADYLFRSSRVVVELKSLQEDFAVPERLQNKIAKLWEKWFAEGSVKFGDIFRADELPREKRRLIEKLYSEPIRRVLKKANRQLRNTADKLGVNNPRNLLLIANDGLYSLEPEFIIRTIARLLQREFSSIHGFVYFTVNRYVDIPTDENARQLWVPLYSDSAPSDLSAFVNDLGAKWLIFSEIRLAGGMLRLYERMMVTLSEGLVISSRDFPFILFVIQPPNKKVHKLPTL
jgi:hypothetical protein